MFSFSLRGLRALNVLTITLEGKKRKFGGRLDREDHVSPSTSKTRAVGCEAREGKGGEGKGNTRLNIHGRTATKKNKKKGDWSFGIHTGSDGKGRGRKEEGGFVLTSHQGYPI